MFAVLENNGAVPSQTYVEVVLDFSERYVEYVKATASPFCDATIYFSFRLLVVLLKNHTGDT